MYLETQYFRIITTDQITGKIKLSIGKKRKLDANRKYCNSKKGQEKRRESKKVYRKTERGKAMAKKSTAKYKKTEQGRANAKKKATAKYKNASNFPKTINEFKKRIKDGPFYICVICNRSLYKRSLKIFCQTDYIGISEQHFRFKVKSFDGKEFICTTCHSKLKKGKIPPQAVSNNLQILISLNLSLHYADWKK